MNQPELVSFTSSLEFCTALSSQKFTFSPFFLAFCQQKLGYRKVYPKNTRCTPKYLYITRNQTTRVHCPLSCLSVKLPFSIFFSIYFFKILLSLFFYRLIKKISSFNHFVIDKIVPNDNLNSSFIDKKVLDFFSPLKQIFFHLLSGNI